MLKMLFGRYQGGRVCECILGFGNDFVHLVDM